MLPGCLITCKQRQCRISLKMPNERQLELPSLSQHAMVAKEVCEKCLIRFKRAGVLYGYFLIAFPRSLTSLTWQVYWRFILVIRWSILSRYDTDDILVLRDRQHDPAWSSEIIRFWIWRETVSRKIQNLIENFVRKSLLHSYSSELLMCTERCSHQP